MGRFAKALAAGVAGLTLVPSGAALAPPSNPGPWKLVGKAATSRIGTKLHVSRTASGMKALAFVVASRSPRRLHVEWASYCEEQSDDGYTENFMGKLSGMGRITYYPHVFDGATTCDVWINASPLKGARVVAGVFSY
jgi:hypothetical protein